MYPFMALMSAVAVYTIMKFLAGLRFTVSILGFEIIPFIFLIVVSYEPYRKILKSTLNPTEAKGSEEYYTISTFLKDGIVGKYDLNGYLFTHENYHPQTSVYVYMLNEKGVDFAEIDYKNLHEGNKVIVHQEIVRTYIDNTYTFEEEIVFNNVSFYTIKGPKNVD